MKDQEIFYRNVMIDYDEREEAIVRANSGYGTVVEVVLDGGIVETTIRLSEAGALALGHALKEAAEALMRTRGTGTNQ